MSNLTKPSNTSNTSNIPNTTNDSEKKKRTFQKKKTSYNGSEKYKGKSSSRSNTSNNSSTNSPSRDQSFYDELHTASDIFFEECLIHQKKADEIMTRCKYEISYTGYNKWFQLNNNDTIDIGKETKNTFKRSVFFRNRNFQQRVIDFYYKNLPEVELKFIGPTRSGDLLLKLMPYEA
jgi:hypothetical protein